MLQTVTKLSERILDNESAAKFAYVQSGICFQVCSVLKIFAGINLVLRRYIVNQILNSIQDDLNEADHEDVFETVQRWFFFFRYILKAMGNDTVWYLVVLQKSFITFAAAQ